MNAKDEEAMRLGSVIINAHEAGRKQGNAECFTATLQDVHTAVGRAVRRLGPVYTTDIGAVANSITRTLEELHALAHPPEEPEATVEVPFTPESLEQAGQTAEKALAEAHEVGRREGYEEGEEACAASPCECDAMSERSRGYDEGVKDKSAAVQAEHEKTQAEMLGIIQKWKQMRLYSGRQVIDRLVLHLHAESNKVYRLRTKPHREWDPETLKAAATCAFDATIAEARREAAKAEHELTVEDMDALHREWCKGHSDGIPPSFDFSFNYVRARIKCRYAERTSPKPDDVFVRMPRKTYRAINVATGGGYLEDMHLVDPPGEKEKT